CDWGNYHTRHFIWWAVNGGGHESGARLRTRPRLLVLARSLRLLDWAVNRGRARRFCLRLGIRTKAGRELICSRFAVRSESVTQQRDGYKTLMQSPAFRSAAGRG